MPSTTRGSCVTRASRSHALSLVRMAHTRLPSTFNPLVVIAVDVWGTVPHSMIAALTSLGLSVAAANAALGAPLESIEHVNMLMSRLRHSSPTRWRGACVSSFPAAWIRFARSGCDRHGHGGQCRPHPRCRPLLRRHRGARPCAPPPAPTRPLAHAPTADWYIDHHTSTMILHTRRRQRQPRLLLHAPTAARYTGSSCKNGIVAHIAPHAPLPLPSVRSAPQHANSAFAFPCALPHTPLLPPAVASQHAHSAFFSSEFPPSRPFPLPACRALRRVRIPARTYLQRIAPRLRARTHARARTDNRR